MYLLISIVHLPAKESVYLGSFLPAASCRRLTCSQPDRLILFTLAMRTPGKRNAIKTNHRRIVCVTFVTFCCTFKQLTALVTICNEK